MPLLFIMKTYVKSAIYELTKVAVFGIIYWIKLFWEEKP